MSYEDMRASSVGGQMNALSAGGSLAPKSDRPLDRIGIAAERIAKAAYHIGEFNERFYGPGPGNAAVGDDIGSGHGGNIGRLFDAIEQLEQRVGTLNTIG